ncbi:F-box/kelch-repeat protein At1g80440-like [Impatiens glandulifera]|uniref:F-box/kelch-repeat protein At1g80440-like n=1 Tax=Impatiens glandulifera TaxID=253017 RepID=UPI001FB15923|nr:F-box/kelch-repeat protein At1g80440-like [Impatiens glandulifera]
METPIDGLPESLILDCLARLHFKDLPVASRVCRKWFHLIRSPHFYTIRKQLGYTNQVACLLQEFPPPTTIFSVVKYVINVFDPMNRGWNRLPPIPNLTNGLSYSTSIASSEGKLVVFSTCNPESRDPVMSVFVFDFATQRWRKGKDMPLTSSSKYSIVTSQCHRVFISGHLGQGEDAVLEYNVRTDEWTELHRVRGGQIEGLQVIGEELWVIGGCKGILNFSMFEHGADVYHLQTEKWRRVEWAFGDLLCPCCLTEFELYEWKKKLFKFMFKNMHNCCRLQLGTQRLLMAIILKDHYCSDWDWVGLFFMQGQDSNFERLHPPSNSVFSGIVGSSCCVEF